MNSRILLAEDDPDIAIVVADLLQSRGHEIVTVLNGHEGLREATTGDYAVLILDVMLPGPSGLVICHAARQHGFSGGILMLTARSQITDKVQGLHSGADDYLVKPFHPDELLARIDALLRRIHKGALTPVLSIQLGPFNADFERPAFTKAGERIFLTPKEAELLRLLVNHRGQVLSREALLRQVWKESPSITTRTVDVHIGTLRQKIEPDPALPTFITTVRGEGYRLDCPKP